MLVMCPPPPFFFFFKNSGDVKLEQSEGCVEKSFFILYF